MIWASLFWGLGFVAAVWALEAFSPPAIVAYRFGIAWLLSLIVTLPRFGWKMWPGIVEGIIPGVFVSLTMIFQTYGLQTTTATKSGFILGLYVFLVPLWERIFEGISISIWHWGYVLLAMLGSILMLGNPFNGDFQKGDWLTLIAMVFGSVQIFWLSYRLRRMKEPLPPEVYNGWQMFWSAIPACLVLLWQPADWVVTSTSLGWMGLMILSVGSTWLAFHLQVVSQAHLSGSTASLLCLLESPFAAIFALCFLQESLELLQWIGCLLIMISAFGSLRLGHSATPSPIVEN